MNTGVPVQASSVYRRNSTVAPGLGSSRELTATLSVSVPPSVTSADGVELTAGRAVTSSVTVADRRVAARVRRAVGERIRACVVVIRGVDDRSRVGVERAQLAVPRSVDDRVDRRADAACRTT